MPADWLSPSQFYLADHDDTDKVYFTNANAPAPVPVGATEYGVELQEMREGEEGPGFRVALLAGATQDSMDFEFTVPLLSDAQIEKLEEKYFRLPAESMRLTYDGGLTYWVVVWAKTGYAPKAWPTNWKRRSGALKLHGLKRVS